MGIFDLFARGDKVERKIAKSVAHLKQVYAQPESRRAAMETLLQIGTPEALRGVLARFTYSCNGAIADESEKRDLVDELVQRGADVVDPLKEYIRTETNLTFAVRALGQIISPDNLKAFLLEVLRSYEPMDYRSGQVKQQIIGILSEMTSPEVVETLLPYLRDHDDDVIYQVIEILERSADERAYGDLTAMLTDDTLSPRIQRRAALAVSRLGWTIKNLRGSLTDEIENDYIIDKKGHLTSKHRASS